MSVLVTLTDQEAQRAYATLGRAHAEQKAALTKLNTLPDLRSRDLMIVSANRALAQIETAMSELYPQLPKGKEGM